jgi:hypothetical protein
MKHTKSSPSIAFDDQGRGEPSLLCLPGWCVDKTSFRYLVEAGSRNRRVSDGLARTWGIGSEQGDFGESALIEDVLSVIEESGVQKVVPVALAHAGWVAIELRRRLAELFKQKPRAYWMEQLEANDVPYTPVYNLAEVFQDPQIQHMGLEIQTDRKTSRSSKPSSSRWNTAMIRANIPRRRQNSASTTASF